MQVEQHPYPHIVATDVLAAEDLSFMLNDWPDRSYFDKEIPGNFALWFNSVVPPEPWREKAPQIVRTLARTILAQFAPWTIRRFGQDLDRVEVYATIMEADPDFVGHKVHNHHYHSPNWVATTLVYLDSDPAGFGGTVIIDRVNPDGVDPVEHAAELFAETSLWGRLDDMRTDCFSVYRALPYRQNTMFSFVDSPISYHCSPRGEPGGTGKRRALRFHICAPWERCQDRYDVTEPEYCALHPTLQIATDQRVIPWAKEDIRELLDPADISAEQAIEWANSLEIHIPVAI